MRDFHEYNGEQIARNAEEHAAKFSDEQRAERLKKSRESNVGIPYVMHEETCVPLFFSDRKTLLTFS